MQPWQGQNPFYFRPRRRYQVHPAYTKPELLATAPNQLWTWDITNASASLSTRLRGPVKWHYYYFYVLLDAFSRYVVGWLIAERESAHLAEELIAASCQQQNIQHHRLTIHSDRGGPMIAKSLALFLFDLGVAQSHSRPYTANDNPFSEAQFKTLKYRPDYPDRFGSLADARDWATPFFAWYNHQHRHTALGLLTPAVVHQCLAEQYRQQRQQVLQAAFTRHPERFIKGRPFPLYRRLCGLTHPNPRTKVVIPRILYLNSCWRVSQTPRHIPQRPSAQ